MSVAFALTAELFGIFSYLIEERTGIHYGPEGRHLLADKIERCAMDSGFTTPLEYYYALRYDDASGTQFDAFVDALVVNETYFFRESDALRAVIDLIVRPAVARSRRARVWCAACATGEEPLTLAMMLDERDLLQHVDIVATDISRRALRYASEGMYRGRSLRSLPHQGVERWIDRDGDTATVAAALRRKIQWSRVNLIDHAAIERLGGFDAILCRNVLIYFADSMVAPVVSSIARRLDDGGVLVVGASESLLRFGTMLVCEERGGVFMYRRVAR
jgi:chemotaxis protein methyltransferase CheR